MESKVKQYLWASIIGISFYAIVMNLSTVCSFLGGILNLALPIIIGSILALFISVPMNAIEKLLTKKKKNNHRAYLLSFLLTVLIVLLVLLLALILLIPELVTSFQNLSAQIKENIPKWRIFLESQPVDMKWLENCLSGINSEQVMQYISDWIDTMMPNMVSALSSSVNTIVTIGFAVIIAIYIILEKAQLCRHTRKLICAYIKPHTAEKVLQTGQMFYRTFSNFLSGQCTEAVILGTLMFFAFTVFNLPYGSLVGVLTAVCAIIPYVGAFLSCTVSIVLTFLLNPALVVRSAVVYLAVQFVENQFIYPRVVGESVGLSPLYTLIASMIGGKLFGIMGIIFFIPLSAVAIEIVKESANQRLNKDIQ